MTTITDLLRTSGEQQKGTELGGLLQWAALHIESLEEALQASRLEHALEEVKRIRLEGAMHAAKQAVEAALESVSVVVPLVEFGRDLAGHINVMAAHGDPDYLKKNGQSIRHVDTRTVSARAKK